MLKEFKDFALRGNVMDLAIAFVMGVAFTAIVTSLVNNILMPIIGSFIGDSFSTLTFEINGVAVAYGAFIQAVINFVIIAFVVFMIVKFMNSLKKKEKAEPSAPPAPTKDQELLSEIRDLLKK